MQVKTVKIVISGPQGTGKTTLARRLVALLAAEGLQGGTEEVVIFTTNFEVDETQDGLALEEEGRVRK